MQSDVNGRSKSHTAPISTPFLPRALSNDCGYIGMTRVRQAGLSVYRKAFQNVHRMKNDQAYAEMILADLAEHGDHTPRVIDASGHGWLEIDNEEDYQHAEATLRAHPNFLLSGLR